MDDARPRAMSYAEVLARELPPARPLVAGIIDEESGVILAGPPNVGKTWLALELARSVSVGRTWLCHYQCSRGNVLVIDEESHLRGLQSRLRMLDAGDGLGPDLSITFAVGHGIRFDTQPGIAEIDELCEAAKPQIIIADSLTRLHGADENHAGQMADVFRNAKAIMRKHSASIVFLDHLRKKSLINDPEEMLRGSTEKRAWPDTILFASPSEDGTIAVSHIKSRFTEKIDPFKVRIEVDKDAGTARLAHAGAPVGSDNARANDLIEAIHALQRQAGPDFSDVVKIAAWLNCSPDTVTRHATKLVSAGILAVRTVNPTEKGGRPKKVYDVIGGRD